MTVLFRGSTTTNSSATSQSIALPPGSVAGDLVLVAMTTSNNTVITLGSGLTQLYNAAMGTGVFAIGWKLLTSGDVTTGSLSWSQSTAGTVCSAVVGYTGVVGLGPLGTVTNRAGSSTTITATPVTLTSNQTCLVIRGEKSTSNPGPTVPSPAITQRAARYINNIASPSIYIGDYTAPAKTVAFTDPVASGNGAGVQIALSESGAPSTPLAISVWDGTTERTGCTVTVWNGTSETTGSITERT